MSAKARATKRRKLEEEKAIAARKAWIEEEEAREKKKEEEGIWDCVCCKEEFPKESEKFVPVQDCKHPLCEACFYKERDFCLGSSHPHRRCSLCNKAWPAFMMTVDTESENFQTYYMIPSYMVNIPNGKQPVGFTINIHKKTGDMSYSWSHISINVPYMEGVFREKPKKTKDEILSLFRQKISVTSRADSFEFAEVRGKNLLFLVTEDRKLTMKENENAAYNIVYFSRPRLYLRMTNTDNIYASPPRMAQFKKREMTLPLLSEIVAKVQELNLLPPS